MTTTFLSPMLVSEIPGHCDRIESQSYVFVQPKLDGWCCMANTRTGKIYTRSGAEIKTLPHINAALPSQGPEWLHGELWKSGGTCDTVQSMVKQGDSTLEFHVFDCVSDEGYYDRVGLFFEAIKNQSLRTKTLGPIRIITNIRTHPLDIKWWYDAWIKDGYEGIIIRLDGHGYRSGRSINVFKMKPGTEVI